MTAPQQTLPGASARPTVPLGTTGMRITRVGFGAWAVGGAGWHFGWGAQDDAASVAAIRHAVAAGINWIDTAAVYGLGHSEEIVARALRDLPAGERPYVFTKCGLVWDERDRAAPPREVGDPRSLRREVRGLAAPPRAWNASISTRCTGRRGTARRSRRTGTPSLELKAEGKVRAVGLSNHDVAQLEAAERLGHVDTLQPPFSAIGREVAAAELPWCASHGTGVIVYSPMHSGLLTGAFTAERAGRLPADDWRSRAPEFTGAALRRNLALAAALEPVARRHGVPVAAVAVAWTLAWPGVDRGHRGRALAGAGRRLERGGRARADGHRPGRDRRRDRADGRRQRTGARAGAARGGRARHEEVAERCSGRPARGRFGATVPTTLVVLNPASGHGLGRTLRPRIERGLRDAGIAFDLVETAAPGHAVELARATAEAGVDRVLAAGGDGTTHEVANGLLQAPSAPDGATGPALGTLPIGTGNDFAKLLNVFRLQPEAAAQRMAGADVRLFDVGRVLGEHFDNSLGIGFDAEVARQANQTRRLKGLAVYVVAVYKSFASFRAPTLAVTSTAHTETGPMMMLECSIGRSAGGGFYLTPDADPSDGLLDVCLIRKVGLVKFLRHVPKVLSGRHVGLPEVTMSAAPASRSARRTGRCCCTWTGRCARARTVTSRSRCSPGASACWWGRRGEGLGSCRRAGGGPAPRGAEPAGARRAAGAGRRARSRAAGVRHGHDGHGPRAPHAGRLPCVRCRPSRPPGPSCAPWPSRGGGRRG